MRRAEADAEAEAERLLGATQARVVAEWPRTMAEAMAIFISVTLDSSQEVEQRSQVVQISFCCTACHSATIDDLIPVDVVVGGFR